MAKFEYGPPGDAVERMLNWERPVSRRIYALLGDTGSGKTSVLSEFCRRLRKEHVAAKAAFEKMAGGEYLFKKTQPQPLLPRVPYYVDLSKVNLDAGKEITQLKILGGSSLCSLLNMWNTDSVLELMHGLIGEGRVLPVIDNIEAWLACRPETQGYRFFDEVRNLLVCASAYGVHAKLAVGARTSYFGGQEKELDMIAGPEPNDRDPLSGIVLRTYLQPLGFCGTGAKLGIDTVWADLLRLGIDTVWADLLRSRGLGPNHLEETTTSQVCDLFAGAP